MSGNPGGRKLVEVMPPELYARFDALRARYVRRDRDIDDLRPILAAARLYDAAVENLGLVPGRGVERDVERLARRAAVDTTDTRLRVDPESLLDAAAEVQFAAELDCVAKVIALVESADAIA